ncbi:MAG: hypothetical protein BalsKO_28110 [Balneolaceae bacterium]
MEYVVLLILHVFLALIIIGGLFIARFIVIPHARKTNNSDFAFNYFEAFNTGAHAVLFVQFLIGFRLGMTYLPISDWFTFSSSMSLTLVLKFTVWIALFAWLIVGKRIGLIDPEKKDLSKASTYYGILTFLGLTLMILGLNVRLVLF